MANILILCYLTLTTNRTKENGFEFLPNLPTLLIGSIFAIIFEESKKTLYGFQQIKSKEAQAANTLVSCVITLCVTMIVIKSDKFITESNQVLYSDVSFFVGLFILKELLFPSIFVEIFELSILRFIGKISYPIYLLHSIAMGTLGISLQGLVTNEKNRPLLFEKGVFLVLGSIMYSTPAHYFMEYPINMLTRRGSNMICNYYSTTTDLGFEK